MINHAKEKNINLLFDLIDADYIEGFRLLLKLKSGQDLALWSDEYYGTNALMLATLKERSDFVAELLCLDSANDQVFAFDTRGETVLMHAVRKGHVDIVDQLLALESASKQVGQRTHRGITALSRAEEYGHTEIAEKLKAVLRAQHSSSALQ